MFTLKLALEVVVLLAIMLCAFKFLKVFPFKIRTLFTPYTTTVIVYLVIIDLTIYIFYLIGSPSTYELDPRI